MKKIITQKQIEIEGISILLLQKRIRNLHLRILPPTGEVRVSAPVRLSLVQIKKFVEQRIDWIRDKQIEVKNRKIIAPLKFISGEIHNFFGESFKLQVLENSKSNAVEVREDVLEMRLKNTTTIQQRKKILDDFYRKNLTAKIPEIVAKYEAKMNVRVAEFRIKKMKTRWGTCNVRARRIWLSLELAKKPLECLEFIVVHEMTHLFERKHNQKFYALMDKFLPEWKKLDVILKNKTN
ncbi:MAG: M48 family metallopeptidase [Rickettsiales bacterium]|nr:M48 family metallopeptidase [Rickettsiales bacterium]